MRVLLNGKGAPFTHVNEVRILDVRLGPSQSVFRCRTIFVDRYGSKRTLPHKDFYAGEAEFF